MGRSRFQAEPYGHLLFERREGIKIMAHDVFISYASEDKNIADATCAKLEEHGIRCWIAPRDVEPGANWGEAIVEAISSSRIMVFVFSSNSNQSQHVFREVERAVDREVTIIPLRVENILPSKPIEFFISAQHWLDAITPPLEDHLNTLAEKIRLILGKGTPPPAPLASRKKSVLIPAIAFLGVILILAGIVRLVYLGADGQESPRHPDGHSTKPSQNEAVVPANTDSTGPVGHLHTPGSAVNTLPGQGADYSRKPNREPDDSRDRANHLGFGDSIQGEIGKEGDQEDWYKVTMPTNGTFKCRVTNLHRSGVEHGDINPVSLFNEQGERLTQTSWFRPGIPVDSKAVSVSAGQAYYIQIQARQTSSAPYSLSLSFTPR
ncbi:MAG: toll/interleukin-1 receptor domain-containing protein [Planctomycetes bacterium]|nr:toll/interleukin-1 receptor domain-containing protein [Planctomycetota bacterium]